MTTTQATNITLRASRLPLAAKCGGSVRPASDGISVNERNDQADVGSAVHDALYELVAHGDLQHTISQIAAARGVADAFDDVQALYHMGRRAWKQIGGWMERVLASEHALDAPAPWGSLTGHADVIGQSAEDPKRIIVLDWKSGRLDSDYFAQMAAYAHLALKAYPTYESATVVLVWLRDQEVEVYDFSRDESARWLESTGAKIANWDGTFEPGTHCAYCPRRHDCPARLAMMRSDLHQLDAAGDEAGVDAMVGALVDAAEAQPASADRLAELLEKAKHIEALAHRVRSTVRDRLAESGHPLKGDQYQVSTSAVTKTELDAHAAWPVLARGIEEDELRRLARLPKTKVYDVLRATAPKGKKKALIEDYESELDRAGALRRSSYQKLSVKRSDKAIEQRSNR